MKHKKKVLLGFIISASLLCLGATGLIVQWQNGGSTIGTFLAFLRVNCSTGMTCTYGSGTVTMTAAGSGGTGTVSANSGSAGALANYAAAGGSTTVGPDSLLTDSGTVLTYTGTGGITATGAPITIGANSGSAGQLVLKGSTSGGCNLTTNGTGVTDTFSCAVSASSSNVTVQYSVANHLVFSATAPTISSAFGSSPTISAPTGTAAFTINVGTGGTATNGVIGLPTATTGWSVHCDDVTTQSATAFVTKQIASTTTTATIANFTTAGAQGAWNASDILNCQAAAY